MIFTSNGDSPSDSVTGERLGEKGGVAGKLGDVGPREKDWLLLTAEDTAWAKRDGVAGE